LWCRPGGKLTYAAYPGPRSHGIAAGERVPTLVTELLTEVRPFHILDEPMVERVKRRGGLAIEDAAPLAQHFEAAAAIGAKVVLVTCSTISRVADTTRSSVAIPVLKIDEAMIRVAVSQGRRMGVIATAASTLEPTRRLLETEAARQGEEVVAELVLVEGAIAALFAGDGEKHDRLVAGAALDLAARSDVVVLAQASMARALTAMPESQRPAPILSSPYLALAQVKALLADLPSSI
jgi:aspartate/glutamate racemase